MSSTDSKLAKIQEHFTALSSVAASLNIASDELTKIIGVLDESLKKLNVGLTVWVKFVDRTGGGGDPDCYDQDEIGYTKVGGTWGIALRHIWGDASREEFNREGPWLFNDAPRSMRILGVDKIGDVIVELVKAAAEATKNIQAKTKELRELAEAVGKIANGAKPKPLQPGYRPPPPPGYRPPLPPLLGTKGEK